MLKYLWGFCKFKGSFSPQEGKDGLFNKMCQDDKLDIWKET